MNKRKQRAVHFTEEEWQEIQKAADKLTRGNKSSFVAEAALKSARKVIK